MRFSRTFLVTSISAIEVGRRVADEQAATGTRIWASGGDPKALVRLANPVQFLTAKSRVAARLNGDSEFLRDDLQKAAKPCLEPFVEIRRGHEFEAPPIVGGSQPRVPVQRLREGQICVPRNMAQDHSAALRGPLGHDGRSKCPARSWIGSSSPILIPRSRWRKKWCFGHVFRACRRPCPLLLLRIAPGAWHFHIWEAFLNCKPPPLVVVPSLLSPLLLLTLPTIARADESAAAPLGAATRPAGPRSSTKEAGGEVGFELELRQLSSEKSSAASPNSCSATGTRFPIHSATRQHRHCGSMGWNISDTDREKDFRSTVPYFVYTLRLIVKNDNEAIRSWDDLRKPKGKKYRVGVLRGSFAQRYMDEQFRQDDVGE